MIIEPATKMKRHCSEQADASRRQEDMIPKFLSFPAQQQGKKMNYCSAY